MDIEDLAAVAHDMANLGCDTNTSYLVAAIMQLVGVIAGLPEALAQETGYVDASEVESIGASLKHMASNIEVLARNV